MKIMKKKLIALLMLSAFNVTLNATPEPEIVVQVLNECYVITAYGEGEVWLYVDDENVENPYTVPRGLDSFYIDVMAYAQGEDNEMSSASLGVCIEPYGADRSDPREIGCWFVALDKDDNEIWMEMDGHRLENISFDLCHYTNWNYYDYTGTTNVRTYFVIDGKRYIADGYNPEYYNYYDNTYLLVQSNEYMYLKAGSLDYNIFIDDDYVYICGEQPTGKPWYDYIVLTDKDGNEIEKDCSYRPDIALDKATYGSSNVYFHFKRTDDDDGWWNPSIRYYYYGAENDGMAATPGVPFANELCYNSTNNFSVPAGYHYRIGIYVDSGGYYLYLLQGDPVQEGDVAKKGDADGDGQVTINDVTTLINYLLSGNASSVNETNADCDGNGKITIDDVTTLINYLLSGKW